MHELSEEWQQIYRPVEGRPAGWSRSSGRSELATSQRACALVFFEDPGFWWLRRTPLGLGGVSPKDERAHELAPASSAGVAGRSPVRRPRLGPLASERRDAGRASPGQWRNGLAEGYGKFIHADGGRPGFLTSEHELGYPHGKWLVPPAALDGVTERRAIATPCEASLHSH